MSLRALLLPVTFLCILLAACNTSSEETVGVIPTPETQLRVVTSNNIIADWVSNVGGDNVDVFAIVPAGSDPHTFHPGARDVTRLANADVFFTIGLGLEASWMNTLIENTSVDTSRIVVLGDGVNPLLARDDDGESPYETFDPHFWMDPLRVKVAVSEIANQLSSRDPTHLGTYQGNASSYNQNIEDLHLLTQEQLQEVPTPRKVLITSHDSLQYFAQRYRFTVIGTVIKDSSTERKPTASELAELEEIINQYDVQSVFGETTVSSQLSEMLAKETDAKVYKLYSGSLGPAGSGAATYIGMFRTNIGTIVEALK